MSKNLILSIATIVSSTSAFAADLPSRAMSPAYVPPIPVFSWTGVYIGAEAGYGFGDTSFKFNLAGPTFPAVGNRFDGFVGGGTLGYNRQFGNVVLGVEGDISYSDMRGAKQTDDTPEASPPCVTPGEGCHARVDWFGTGRGRIGYAWDRYLAYATGGIAVGGLKGSVDEGACPGCTIDRTRVGWTAGGGVEWAAYQNWSVKVEYLYTDFDRPGGIGDTDGFITTHDYKFSTVRAGINYKFGDPVAPVVAKY